MPPCRLPKDPGFVSRKAGAFRQSDAPNHLVRGVSAYSSVFSVPSVMAGVSSGASRDFFSALT